MPEYFRCKNCGHKHEIKSIVTSAERSRKQNNNGNGRGYTFHSVQRAPTGFVRSLVWFMRGNKQQPDPAQTIRVVSEVKQSPTNILIRELDFPRWVTVDKLAELARVYIGWGYRWSRENTVDNTSFTQGQHRKMNKAFLHLRFLEKVNNNQYNLTGGGKRFLRHYYTGNDDTSTHDKYIAYDR